MLSIMISILPTALQALIGSILWTDAPPPSLTFRLRHTHAITNRSRAIFTDVPLALAADRDVYSIQTRPTVIHRPSSRNDFMSSRFSRVTDAHLWIADTTEGPNVEKRETLLELAKMTHNTYFEPNSKEWYDLGSDWNTVCAVSCPCQVLVLIY